MTEEKDFKKIARARAAKTGEGYSAARRQLAEGDAVVQCCSHVSLTRDLYLEAQPNVGAR